jgi:hypothetical protein
VKRQSLKQMALQIATKEMERWRKELAAADTKHEFDLSNINIRLGRWIEAICRISNETINAALLNGSKIEVDGREFLPSDLHIIKQHHAKAAAAPLVEAYDRNKSHGIAINKLWQPSLFAKLDYEAEREKLLALGDLVRVSVGEAMTAHWRLNDHLKDANFEGQKSAYNLEVESRGRRSRLFRENPDCKTTDELMKKLGAWKG